MTSPLDRAALAHNHALATSDPDAWDIAADAYEEYGEETEAGFCRALRDCARRGGVPSMLGPMPPSSEDDHGS